jgi:hypothetical protein
MTWVDLRMRTLPVAVVAALLTGLPAVAADATASGPKAPTAAGGSAAPFGARLTGCRRSLRLEARVAAVTAAMHPIAGGPRLALRIELAQRPLAGGRWTVRSDVPGLGAWTSPSDPTIGSRSRDVFKYHQAVGRLIVGFAYRFRVGFRWLGAQGAIVRVASATTRACREPDLRPDLVLSRVRVLPAARPHVVRYAVTVRNAGRSTARGIVVSATFADVANERTRTVHRLKAGEAAQVTFAGPACAAGAAPPSFAVDPANAIDEANEANNRLVVACPSA